MSNKAETVTHAAMMTIISSLAPKLQQSIKKIAAELVNLGLNSATIDTMLSSIILEAAENQYITDACIIPPPKESSIDLLKNLFSEKINKKQGGN